MTTNPTTTARKLTADQTTEELLVAYVALEGARGPEIPVVRGWIMDELESREELGALAVALGRCPECWAAVADCECYWPAGNPEAI